MPVIIVSDTTAEIDDQWMLTHLLLLDNIDILGVISTHYGNRTGKDESLEGLEINKKIVKLTNRDNIPLIKGRSTPLIDRSDIDFNNATGFYNLINNYKGNFKITVIQSGPATEVPPFIMLPGGL